MSQSSAIEAPLVGVAAKPGRNMFSGWAHRVESWLTRRHGWQELALLDDHLLKDVGFSREDLSPEGRQAIVRAAWLHN
jgi:uncharacterized protein YjiS (DUF1127 family)